MRGANIVKCFKVFVDTVEPFSIHLWGGNGSVALPVGDMVIINYLASLHTLRAYVSVLDNSIFTCIVGINDTRLILLSMVTFYYSVN